MSEGIARDAVTAKNNEALLNRFIDNNRHFILAAAYRATGHFVTESDDVYSIALIAFHEAVQSYEEDKGNFHSFAGLVIKRRIYDYLRSESRFAEELPISPSAVSDTLEEDSPEMSLHLEVRQREAELSEQNTSLRPEGTPVRDEIEAMQIVLNRYGFSFFDLTECSPKAEKTKKACADAIVYMLNHENLLQDMRRKGTLPVKELKKYTSVSGKILERHRKYIIAAIEILNGDYPLLAEYMSYIKKALVT